MIYQVAKHLADPYFVLLGLLGLVLVSLWYRRRETKRGLLALTIPYLLLLAVSLPVVAKLAMDSLESQYPLLEHRPHDVQAIVVIGGGQGASYFRCRLAAALYHQGSPCPVLLSSSPAEAKAMREHLLQLGVAESDLLEDKDSSNTFENAVNSRKILEPLQIGRIALVTDATHMPRAAACFRKTKFDVVPAGQPNELFPWEQSFLDFMPVAGAASRSQYASQEWLGLAWYWLWGRV